MRSLTSVVILAQICFVSSIAQIEPPQKCSFDVTDLIWSSVHNDDAMACSKETGFLLGFAPPAEATWDKILNSQACNKWWNGVVSSINLINPPCTFNNLDNTPGTTDTASFNWKLRDLVGVTQSMNGTTAPSTTPLPTNTSKTFQPTMPSPTTTPNSPATTVLPSANPIASPGAVPSTSVVSCGSLLGLNAAVVVVANMFA
ncbi:hypothetical protein AeNC1_004242 [Aphanomyces euteiches]|nr:hypothetical protein AeNC1_004242 [Aphanomyces euteiches]